MSHCWGGAEDILTVTSENQATLMIHISLETLPKSFRDAVTITHALGINKLWVDCQCIVQDSSDDWISESAVMGQILENATCTILAASSANSHQGCFFRRDLLSSTSCRVAGGVDGLFASDYRQSMLSSKEHDKPLNQRAWTFQEQLLSPRVIEFNQWDVKWRCLQGDASEMDPCGFGSFQENGETHSGPIFGDDARHGLLTMNIGDELGSFKRLQRSCIDSSPFRSSVESALTFHRLWDDIVGEYSGRKLTHSSDKLVALSGIASSVLAANPTKRYVAGLWVDTKSKTSDPFPYGLLWYVRDPKHRSTRYLAPTWSWASQTEQVSSAACVDTVFKPLIQIISIRTDTHPLEIACVGAVRCGDLIIRGMAKPIGELIVTRLSTKRECLTTFEYYSGFSLSERGQELGHFLPDTAEPFHITHLLLVRRFEKVTQNQFDTFGRGYRHHGFVGLGLELRHEVFWRVGLFAFEWDGTGAMAEKWFDWYKKEDITVR